ncbi:MAG: hypothetical protein H6747_10225, partial [Deltaproteobacteria bacterium]|nr:hypothetical protein [Deltaproteobacteria bacterium]
MTAPQPAVRTLVLLLAAPLWVGCVQTPDDTARTATGSAGASAAQQKAAAYNQTLDGFAALDVALPDASGGAGDSG